MEPNYVYVSYTSLQWCHMVIMVSRITGNVLFVQQHVQGCIQENNKASQNCPFWGKSISDQLLPS